MFWSFIDVKGKGKGAIGSLRFRRMEGQAVAGIGHPIESGDGKGLGQRPSGGVGDTSRWSHHLQKPTWMDGHFLIPQVHQTNNI